MAMTDDDDADADAGFFLRPRGGAAVPRQTFWDPPGGGVPGVGRHPAPPGGPKIKKKPAPTMMMMLMLAGTKEVNRSALRPL